ncbi:F-box domain-containing protein [Colletotrichum higginsianum IMI 349063]|uniref:F-box domain-containing protein n=1 Tax=Colletotrichum higginsianum (strain IMI 349063) TaxID=759273 RepID=A0A1B7YSD8_COLHI|nr:F-box domain-containing protein [Colletotrichum higginsianum IMI 349063]OBR14960.1 F-box domain-containing protein [Colletotrichum higginsianum IMI 349063]
MSGTRFTPVHLQGSAFFEHLDSLVGDINHSHAPNKPDSVNANISSLDDGTCPGSFSLPRFTLAPGITQTHALTVSHKRSTSPSHIMDQNTQIVDYNNTPGAHLPLSAQEPLNMPVQQFSQLAVCSGGVPVAGGVGEFPTAPNVQPSNASWMQDVSVTDEDNEDSPDSDNGATQPSPPANPSAGLPGSLTTPNDSPGPFGVSTRFSAHHTSNHHIENRIHHDHRFSSGDSLHLTLQPPTGRIPPRRLRDRAHDGQVQHAIREPVAPGPSTSGVPPNNFRRPNAISGLAHFPLATLSSNSNGAINGGPGITSFPLPLFNNGPSGAEPAHQAAGQRPQLVSVQGANMPPGRNQVNDSLPRNDTGGQASAGSYGLGLSAGNTVNLAAIADAGEGAAQFAPTGIFRPMNAVTRPFYHPDFDSQRELKRRLGISPNYAGDASIARNQSAAIPDSENVAFWITNLPPRVTHNQLLGQIRGMGRIWACVISPPAGDHATSAAKVVFFELAAAQKFLAHCSDPQRRLIVGGYVARVCLNRTKKAEENVEGNHSRVVIIQGNPSFVNPVTLLRHFSKNFEYDIDEIITHVLNSQMGHVEIRFGSWRSQAETSRQCIKAMYPPGGDLSPVWSLRYGTDPCSI